MPWKEADRTKYDVIRAQCSTDVSEAELALIAPLAKGVSKGQPTP
jgi:hypothetical protein